ncbi:MAG: siroheme synthase [Fibrobacteraceae bacterium]|nr:siroheme synthase [Fibrobacteraceae bacterium]
MNVVLIIAHHCILPGAFKGFEEVLDRLHHEMPGTRVASTSLLDLENDLRTILREDGVESVTLLPYLLLNGQHAKNDVPKVVASLQQEFPETSIKLLPCLGDWDLFANMVVDGLKNAIPHVVKCSEAQTTVQRKPSAAEKSKLFAMEFNMDGRNVLVVGGGSIASRKIKTLLPAGAKIKVVAPQIAEDIAALAANNPNQMELVTGSYEARHLNGISFAFICTDQPSVNAQVVNDAVSRRIFVNNACDYRSGDFIVPARMDFGEHIVVTVSTQGHSPSTAKKLKKKIQTEWSADLVKIEQENE